MNDIEDRMKAMLEEEVHRRKMNSPPMTLASRRPVSPRLLDLGRLTAAAALVGLSWIGVNYGPRTEMSSVLEQALPDAQRIRVIMIGSARFIDIALGEGGKTPEGDSQ